MRLLRRVTWMLIGASLAYLFDPVSGRSRRARLKDQALARMREGAGLAGRKARYQAGKARGVAHEIFGAESLPVDDDQLLQKVRSEAVGRVPGSLQHIDLTVDDGVVVLTGLSQDRDRERDLIDRIKDVSGVRFIRNELVGS